MRESRMQMIIKVSVCITYIVNLCCREIGGCMRPVWPQYFANANLFLYVISINATGLLATAVIELHSLLIHPDVQVILLILNTNCVY